MKRIWLNIRYIVALSVKYTGIIYALLGFIGTFVPLSDIFYAEITLIKRIVVSCCILLGIWVIVFVVSCIYVYNKKRYQILDVGNGHGVYVQYGDIFSCCSGEHIEEKNIIIPVNRCFDTIIDDDLISRRTLHGIAMDKLYSNHIYTQEKLNDKIQTILTSNKNKYETISIRNKRKGNLKRYEVGTVVEIPGEVGITYFFLGLTEFDRDLHAHTEDEDYVLALIRMLVYNNKRSQGRPLFVPLIGAGAANTKKEERDILEYLVKLIKLNRKLINCDLYIVIRDSTKDSIRITGL